MADMEENVSVSYLKSLIYCINIIILVVVILSEQEAPFFLSCHTFVLCTVLSAGILLAFISNLSCVPCDPGSRFARVLTITMITIVTDRDI